MKESKMFEKILIATDLSRASESIVNCAVAFNKIDAERSFSWGVSVIAL